jgi:hypothetical protein
MATGSGTGTPATAAGSATLSALRARIRTQIQSASGFTEPLVVTPSPYSLAQLRDRVAATLQDSGNTRWSTDDIDEALRHALEQYSRRNPNHVIGTITLTATGREISLSSLNGLLRVEKVWWDYDSTAPGYPPHWRQFEVWPGGILYIDDESEPQNGDVVRIWYTQKHTLNGLDGATTTTLPDEDVGYLISGAAHLAALSRAIELSETLNVDDEVVARLRKYADEMGQNFRFGVSLRPPAWQRRAYAYDQDDIDEAIRWALHRYSEAHPDETTTTVTLSADGREVDISGITAYQQITRVWWDYDASDPAHPPRWRDFEVWPGDVLFIDSAGEPQSGDAVRIWYTRARTLNGLDGASATTLPVEDETLIVTGAAGYVAQERVQEEGQRFVPRKLREWAAARIREFERGLKAVARHEAARHSGVAGMAPLDRWDQDDDGW